jgi:hypothetical protein
MSNNRPNLGFGAELEEFDPASWTPPAKKPGATEKAATRQLAEATGFRSREPAEAPTRGAASGEKVLRRRRTGRNAQFNLKARPETIEAFCRIADAQGWGLGETLEHAVALLEREYSKSKTP